MFFEFFELAKNYAFGVSLAYSSSYSNPGSSYPDIPRSVIPAYHSPVEDEEGPRYYDGGENSDTGFPEDDQVHGGVNFAPLRIFGPIPSTSPTMNQRWSSSRRPGIQIFISELEWFFCSRVSRSRFKCHEFKPRWS